MTAPTLLLSPRMSSDSKILWNAAGNAGWRVERPRTWAPYGVTHLDALHGEYDWARHAAEMLGIGLLSPPQDWLTRLPAWMLGRRVQFGKLEDLKITYPVFLKPPEYKTFAAQVYDAPPMVEGPVIASEPVQILHEVRVWILDGQPVTAGIYVEDGRLEEESDRPLVKACELAAKAAKVDGTPRAVVIDVMFVAPGRWVVIEANPCYSSGIYAGHDPRKVLDVLAAAITR